MRIGIYGGTFDPIHRGHMAAAKSAAERLELDRLLLIPAGVPPHKALSNASAEGTHRLEMTGLAADRLGLAIPVDVLDIELCREGKSYTCDTLRTLKEQYPEDELWLLMGTDMFLTLHQWYRPEEILSIAGICAFGRMAEDAENLFPAQKRYLEETYGAKVVTMDLPELVEVSSTEIRAMLAEGKRPDTLDESIYGYILRHRLYGTNKNLKHLDWEDLRACSYSMIRAKRIPHVRGCEEEAVRLARIWGVDENLARAGAILHDCTKYWTMEEHKALCEKYGIKLDDLEQSAVKLLHSKTGACIAHEVFGMPDEVCKAIFWHTTGKADMTTLEKILYIADYMEPNRKFSGVEKLRALVYQDLDAACLLGLEMSIADLERRGNPVHKNTWEARDFLRKEKSNGC